MTANRATCLQTAVEACCNGNMQLSARQGHRAFPQAKDAGLYCCCACNSVATKKTLCVWFVHVNMTTVHEYSPCAASACQSRLPYQVGLSDEAGLHSCSACVQGELVRNCMRKSPAPLVDIGVNLVDHAFEKVDPVVKQQTYL